MPGPASAATVITARQSGTASRFAMSVAGSGRSRLPDPVGDDPIPVPASGVVDLGVDAVVADPVRGLEVSCCCAGNPRHRAPSVPELGDHRGKPQAGQRRQRLGLGPAPGRARGGHRAECCSSIMPTVIRGNNRQDSSAVTPGQAPCRLPSRTPPWSAAAANSGLELAEILRRAARSPSGPAGGKQTRWERNSQRADGSSRSRSPNVGSTPRETSVPIFHSWSGRACCRLTCA